MGQVEEQGDMIGIEERSEVNPDAVGVSQRSSQGGMGKS